MRERTRVVVSRKEVQTENDEKVVSLKYYLTDRKKLNTDNKLMVIELKQGGFSDDPYDDELVHYLLAAAVAVRMNNTEIPFEFAWGLKGYMNTLLREGVFPKGGHASRPLRKLKEGKSFLEAMTGGEDKG